MKILPSTLFWRAFWAQMLLMTIVTMLMIAFIANKQAENTAEEFAALWAPAVKEVMLQGAAASPSQSIRVSRDVQVVRRPPPADAMTPRASTRFTWLIAALRDQGVPIRALRVSGISGNSVVWLDVADNTGTAESQWLGVASSIEGEDLPGRFLVVLIFALLLSALLAAALSHMIARPARMIANVVRAEIENNAFTATSPKLPTSGATEIMALADSVADTISARREIEHDRQIMLSGVSHDIRSPLARIRLATQLLPDDHEHAELRARIVRNVEVIDGLVDGFAHFLRIETEDLADTVDIAVLIDDVVVAEGLPSHTLREIEAVTVSGNYNLLFRALCNLIDNAKQHGEPPIEISVRSSAKEVAIDIVNHGTPIDPAAVPRLLRPFERGESHRGTPGSGLGLAIVSRVAERHGGRLEIAPAAYARGTCATLVLPR